MNLEHPLMNAAGTCKTLEQCARFARSAVSAVMIGSITLEPRAGNSGDVYWPTEGYSLNSLGLPNPGAGYYKANLPTMVTQVHGQGKLLGLSVAGFANGEFAQLVKVGADAGVDFIELNLSCPNVWHGDAQGGLLCFEPNQVQDVVGECTRVAGSVPLGAKISPMSNPTSLRAFADVTNKSGLAFVTAVNTFPNAYAFSTHDTPAIALGLAGMSGTALKPIALGQVKQLRSWLQPDIEIIGAGGVSCGQDIQDFLLAGAAAVQAATLFWNANENPGVYSGLLSEFLALASPQPARA